MTVALTVPDRSLEQRRAALVEANRIRSYRAVLKREIKAGRAGWHWALVDPDCASMKLIDLLLCLPKFGRVKANRVLLGSQISPSKTLGGLTPRQREELVERVAR